MIFFGPKRNHSLPEEIELITMFDAEKNMFAAGKSHFCCSKTMPKNRNSADRKRLFEYQKIWILLFNSILFILARTFAGWKCVEIRECRMLTCRPVAVVVHGRGPNGWTNGWLHSCIVHSLESVRRTKALHLSQRHCISISIFIFVSIFHIKTIKIEINYVYLKHFNIIIIFRLCLQSELSPVFEKRARAKEIVSKIVCKSYTRLWECHSVLCSHFVHLRLVIGESVFVAVAFFEWIREEPFGWFYGDGDDKHWKDAFRRIGVSCQFLLSFTFLHSDCGIRNQRTSFGWRHLHSILTLITIAF